jgi:hypothetical protein
MVEATIWPEIATLSNAQGGQQVLAGVKLILWSHLVRWDASHRRFSAVDEAEFECWWQPHIDSKVGRLLSWIAFTVGTEYVLKGVCLLHGMRKTIEMSASGVRYPDEDENIQDWAAAVNILVRCIPEDREIWRELGSLSSSS